MDTVDTGEGWNPLNWTDWAEAIAVRWDVLGEEIRRRLGPGVSLEPAARDFYASRFTRDVGGAMLHRSPFAGAVARSMSAEALTLGVHVLGDEARLHPGAPRGAALLGHELTHVIQQTDPLPLAPAPSLAGRPAGSAVVQRARADGPQNGTVVQRAEGGGEAAAEAAERALLRDARTQHAGSAEQRARADAEALAERVYQRLVDELRLQRERAPWIR